MPCLAYNEIVLVWLISAMQPLSHTETNGDLDFRLLTEKDVSTFRALRLEGLRDNPLAFGGDYEEETLFSDAYFLHLLKDCRWFGLWHKGRLAGTAALRFFQPVKFRHRGEMWGMYVQPVLRGNGTADWFMTALLSTARQNGIEQIELHVVEPNVHARRFYQKHGFTEIGRMQKAFKLNGNYADDFIMTRFLVS
jgi:GNAT superfamily N-acetyltransferase